MIVKESFIFFKKQKSLISTSDLLFHEKRVRKYFPSCFGLKSPSGIGVRTEKKEADVDGTETFWYRHLGVCHFGTGHLGVCHFGTGHFGTDTSAPTSWH